MQVNNPSSTGAATVQTDGVTIQGDGSAGNKIAIKQVETDTTLSGAGTLASPLGVSNVPVSGYLSAASLGGAATCTANKLYLTVVPIGYWWRASKIGVWVNTADATHNCDIGVYDSTGTLIANVGAQTIAASGNSQFSIVQGTITKPPGLYGFAITSAASTFGILQNQNTLSLFVNTAYGTSAGGALPASIAWPAMSPAAPLLGFYLF